MSEEMAVSDNTTGEDATKPSDGATVETAADAGEVPPEHPIEAPVEHPEEPPAVPEGNLKFWHITYYLIC